jgi:hypothetical protein
MDKHFKFTNALFLLWFSILVEIRFDFDFVEGIYPRTFLVCKGLYLVLLFIVMDHLYNNSIPLLLILLAALQFLSNQSFGVIVLILISGIITWLLVGLLSYWC